MLLYNSVTDWAGVSEWQTRQTQNLLWATTYGFKSHRRQLFLVAEAFGFIVLRLFLCAEAHRCNCCLRNVCPARRGGRNSSLLDSYQEIVLFVEVREAMG